MKTLFTLLLLAGGAAAQTKPVTFKVGLLSCGALRLANERVQTYCYAGSGLVVHNEVASLPIQGGIVILTYNYCRVWDAAALKCSTSDGLVWLFTLTGTTMSWQYTTGDAIVKGTF
jgi:hypothetical protein